MKKLVVVFFSCLAISCGGNNSNTDTSANKEEEVKKSEAETGTPAANPDAVKGLDLVSKSNCFTCHKVDEKFVGPAYQAVAERYTLSDAVLDTLSEKIIKGGSGRWGSVPMTPHPEISKEDAKTMVKYVLSLKK